MTSDDAHSPEEIVSELVDLAYEEPSISWVVQALVLERIRQDADEPHVLGRAAGAAIGETPWLDDGERLAEAIRQLELHLDPIDANTHRPLVLARAIQWCDWPPSLWAALLRLASEHQGLRPRSWHDHIARALVAGTVPLPNERLRRWTGTPERDRQQRS